MSAKTGAGLDELRAALGARGGPCVTATQSLRARRRGAPLRRPRLLAARDRHGRDRDALVGLDRRRRRPPRRAGRSRRPRAERPGARPSRRPGRAGQRVALALPGVERPRLRRGDVLLAPGAFATSYRLDVALEELEPIADGARLLVHHGTSAVPAASFARGERFAQLRLAAPVVAARGDRVVLRERDDGRRRPDPRPALRADTPTPSASSGPSAARRRCTRRCSSTARGASRRPGSRSSRRAERADRGRRPARPGRERAGRAVGEGRAAAASVRAARLEALPPGRGRRASAGARRRRPRSRRELAAAAPGAREGRGRGARPLPRAGRPARPPRRRVRRLGGGLRAGAGARRSRSARAPAGSRSPASATSPAAGGATRSSCSSASTRTASPVGSATSGCFAADRCDHRRRLPRPDRRSPRASARGSGSGSGS